MLRVGSAKMLNVNQKEKKSQATEHRQKFKMCSQPQHDQNSENEW